MMAEATQYAFHFKELVELLIKKQGLHEGFWSIYIKFGINAGYFSFGGADNYPTAMVPVLEIGIHKDEELTPLGLDAAVVNPRSPKTRKSSSKSK
jgi:hypothetical protein